MAQTQIGLVVANSKSYAVETTKGQRHFPKSNPKLQLLDQLNGYPTEVSKDFS